MQPNKVIIKKGNDSSVGLTGVENLTGVGPLIPGRSGRQSAEEIELG